MKGFEDNKLIYKNSEGKITSKKITNGKINKIIQIHNSNLIALIWPSNVVGSEYMNSSLVALNKNGKKIWDAELPIKDNLDFYIETGLENGRLFAWSDKGYRCQISIKTGKIISKEFVK